MTASTNKTLIVIVGPTASGKTDIAVKLAQKLNCPVLSSDSRQFYKEMKIGTARPDADELKGVPHYFLGHKSIHDNYNVVDFEKEALETLKNIYKTNDVAILCGGSGLYINAVCNGFDDALPEADDELREALTKELEEKGIESLQQKLQDLDPEYFQEMDINNPQRLIRAIEVCVKSGKKYSDLRKGQKAERPFRIVKIGLLRDRDELNKRINKRVDEMIDSGLLSEVKLLHKNKDLNALNSVGYKELFQFIDKDIEMEEAVDNIKQNTRQFAKRQMTWFKRDKEIHWFHPADWEAICNFAQKSISL